MRNDTLHLVNRLDLEPIIYKLVVSDEGPNWSMEQASYGEVWYRRFLALNVECPDVVHVPSKIVDIVWHHHILDTQKYFADCSILFGSYFHHYPYFGSRGESDAAALSKAFAETIERFRKEFGEDPVRRGEDLFGSTLNQGALCGGKCGGPNDRTDHVLNVQNRPRLGERYISQAA